MTAQKLINILSDIPTRFDLASAKRAERKNKKSIATTRRNRFYDLPRLTPIKVNQARAIFMRSLTLFNYFHESTIKTTI